MASERVVAVVKITSDSGLLECPVHLLHLIVGPGMVRSGQTMVSAVCIAEPCRRGRVGSPAVGPERFLGKSDASSTTSCNVTRSMTTFGSSCCRFGQLEDDTWVVFQTFQNSLFTHPRCHPGKLVWYLPKSASDFPWFLIHQY